MIGALLIPRPHAPEDAASPRMHRAIAATKKRQQNRPPLDWGQFDEDKLASSLNGPERAAFHFTLAQMHAFEAAAPRNLSILARATPIDDVKASYLGQIDDELVHDAMFKRYRDLVGADARTHPMTRLGSDLAALVQLDPIVGAVGVTTGIEFFAVEVMQALKARIDEPLLQAFIEHIEVDERRHQVLAVEAVAALGRARLVRGPIARARVRAGRASIEAFFRQVTCRAYARQAHVLEIDLRVLYERSLDTIADHFRRELPPEAIRFV